MQRVRDTRLRHQVEVEVSRVQFVGNIEVCRTNTTQTQSTQVPVQRVKIAQLSSLAHQESGKYLK
jgi:hypothetical protein